MPNYKPYNYNQDAMMVINYKDQLQPGTFEHAVHFLIEQKLDLSIFDLRKRVIRKRVRSCLLPASDPNQ
ncbi:MAG: hypothetical protein AB7U63_11540 [Porticoccaceae bacterium]